MSFIGLRREKNYETVKTYYSLCAGRRDVCISDGGLCRLWNKTEPGKQLQHIQQYLDQTG